MSRAIGYLLTWTTYGTWLRGDARGYVGETLLPDGSALPRQNAPGSPYEADDSLTYDGDARRLKSPAVRLSLAHADVVAHAFAELATAREYAIRRAAIMADHIHVAMDADAEEPSETMRKLKSISAVRLTQRFGPPPGRWWTTGGSKRVKYSQSAYRSTIRYVAYQSGKLAEVIDNQASPRAT